MNMRTEIPNLTSSLVATQKERQANKLERKKLEGKIATANQNLLIGVEELLKPIAEELKMNFEVIFTDTSSIIMKKLGSHEEAMCVSYNLVGPNIIFESKDSIIKWADRVTSKLKNMKEILRKTALIPEDSLLFVKAKLETKTRYF